MNPSNLDIYPWDAAGIQLHETFSYDDVEQLLKIIVHPEKLEFNDDWTLKDHCVPGEFDIICGRDKVALNHAGNKCFRKIVDMNREKYQQARTRKDKTRITTEIIASIHKSQGRFLKLNPKTNTWYEVGEEYAHEKVSHALRSAKDPSKRCVTIKAAKRIIKTTFTVEEDETFNLLLEEQQRIFKELLQEIPMSDDDEFVIDFSIVDHFCNAFLGA